MPVTQQQIKITFFGNVPSKKTSPRVLKRGNRSFVLPSLAYCNWEKAEAARLKAIVPQRNLTGYSLAISIYYPNDKIRDEDNTLASIKDLLKVAKITLDDNWQNQSKPPVFDFVGIDRLNPRVEVSISINELADVV